MNIVSTPPKIRNTFAQKSLVNTKRVQRFAPRHYDLNEFIPADHLRDGYLAIQQAMNPLTRTSVASMETLAGHMGVKVRAAQRRMRIYEELGVVQTQPRKNGCRSNLTSVYTFPILDELFLRSRRRGDGVVDDTVKPRKILKQTKTETPPTPKGEVCDVCPEPITTEPPRPTPDREVHAALVAAREMRTQRKAERRQRRYAGAREGRRERVTRRCEEPSPVQQAVRQVMVVLRVSPGLWGTREAIRTSVTRWMEERGVGAEQAANGLIARWKDYEGMKPMLEYPCGKMTWFGECRWISESPSELRELRRASEASIGSYVAPRQVDVASVWAKTQALIAAQDGMNTE